MSTEELRKHLDALTPETMDFAFREVVRNLYELAGLTVPIEDPLGQKVVREFLSDYLRLRDQAGS